MFPSPDLNGTARPPEGDINGFAFRGQETLGKNPTFFWAGVGKCVNAAGLLTPIVGLEPTRSQFLNVSRYLRNRWTELSTQWRGRLPIRAQMGGWTSVSPDCHWNFYETVQLTSVTYPTQRRISVPLWGCSTLPWESVSSWDEDGPPLRIRIGTEWILSPLPLPIGLAEDMSVGLSRLPSRSENRNFLRCIPNSFSRDYGLGTASANQIAEVLGWFLSHQPEATPVGESITTSLLGYRSFVKDYRNHYDSFGPPGTVRTSTCLVRVLHL